RGQLGRELLERDRCAGRRKMILPAFQRPVPDPAPGAGHPVEGLPLIPLGSHAESVGLAVNGHDDLLRASRAKVKARAPSSHPLAGCGLWAIPSVAVNESRMTSVQRTSGSELTSWMLRSVRPKRASRS